MRQHRIFHEGPLEAGVDIELSKANCHYLRQVVRAKPGGLITLFNGNGGEYSATIQGLGKDGCRVAVEHYRKRDLESPLQITLLQGISRGERMDFTVQKSVELGVNRIIPLLTDRSVAKLDAHRRQKRESHWRGVAHAAMAQSGRNRMVDIAPITLLSDYLPTLEGGDDNRLMLSPSSSKGFGSIVKSQKITLLIGPEGGLSDPEERAACASGFTALRLGPRVLRTETAAIAALGLIQGIWGDLG